MELGKYRLNKKIPQTLPFETRKKRLVESEEWNGWIHLHNKHKMPEEINESNIQEEINSIGIDSGLDIMMNIAPKSWLKLALNSDILQVYIPD